MRPDPRSTCIALSVELRTTARTVREAVPLDQIGNGVDPDVFKVDRGRHEETDRPGDAAVRRPIVGVLPRQHGPGERVVRPDGDRIRPSEFEEVRDVEGERRVALADVLAGLLAVDEDLGRVKDGLEFDPDDPAPPILRRFEFAAVPGRAQVVGRLRGSTCQVDGTATSSQPFPAVSGAAQPAASPRPSGSRRKRQAPSSGTSSVRPSPSGDPAAPPDEAPPQDGPAARRPRGRRGRPGQEFPSRPALHAVLLLGGSMERRPRKMQRRPGLRGGQALSSRPIFFRAMSPRFISGPSPGR